MRPVTPFMMIPTLRSFMRAPQSLMAVHGDNCGIVSHRSSQVKVKEFGNSHKYMKFLDIMAAGRGTDGQRSSVGPFSSVSNSGVQNADKLPRDGKFACPGPPDG
jgi:hypothetical protein